MAPGLSDTGNSKTYKTFSDNVFREGPYPPSSYCFAFPESLEDLLGRFVGNS
jgi:hypothetical protein